MYTETPGREANKGKKPRFWVSPPFAGPIKISACKRIRGEKGGNVASPSNFGQLHAFRILQIDEEKKEGEEKGRVISK